MCGIAGIFDVTKKRDLSPIAGNLLSAIEPRGRHAAGYAFHEDGTTIVVKADLCATDFIAAAPMFTEPFKTRPRSILLHARYATQGTPKNNENNHPIYSKVTGLTLIHNGWLSNERAILSKYTLEKDGEVDSETVLRLIEHFMLNEKKKITTAIRLAMAELQGKFACALISEKYPDTMWLWKRGNPLAGMRDEKSGAFFFASTPEMLTRGLKASGITVKTIGELADNKILCLTTKGGKLKGTFGRLGIKKSKKQKPIINTLPFIGMPRQIDFTDDEKKLNATKPTTTGEIVRRFQENKKIGDERRKKRNPASAVWEAWKAQGREIVARLNEDLCPICSERGTIRSSFSARVPPIYDCPKHGYYGPGVTHVGKSIN